MLIVDTIVSCKDDSSSGKSDRSIFETCAGSASAINTRNFRPCRPAYVATFGNVAFMAVPPYTQPLRVGNCARTSACANFVSNETGEDSPLDCYWKGALIVARLKKESRM